MPPSPPRVAQCGHPVLINYAERRAPAEQLAQQIRAAGGQASLCEADIGREEGVLRLFAAADAIDAPLAGLVNNAGVSGGLSRLDALSPRHSATCLR